MTAAWPPTAPTIYVSTGNGTFDTTLNSSGFPSDGDYGDSIIKLDVDPNSSPTNQNINGWGLKVVDYFTPDNQQTLDDDDLDLDSGGVVLLPPQPGSHPNELIAAGKQGTIYVIDCDKHGPLQPDRQRRRPGAGRSPRIGRRQWRFVRHSRVLWRRGLLRRRGRRPGIVPAQRWLAVIVTHLAVGQRVFIPRCVADRLVRRHVRRNRLGTPDQ